MVTTGVVIKVSRRASNTNIEKTLCDKIPAFKPTLSTISSTNLETIRMKSYVARTEAHPLQLIKVPIVAASLHLNPHSRAAIEHPPNLPKKARQQMAAVYPQVIPSSKRPRFVDKPERVKYYGYAIRFPVMLSALREPRG